MLDDRVTVGGTHEAGNVSGCDPMTWRDFPDVVGDYMEQALSATCNGGRQT